MKNLMSLIVCISCIFTFSFPVLAMEVEQSEPTTRSDESTPRLMVTSYSLDTEYLVPGEKAVLKIVLKNTNTKKGVSNIKLSLTEESGEINPVGMGTTYVKSISASGTYTWSVELLAAHTSTIGEHKLTVSAEYEDSNYHSYSSADTIRLKINQSAELKYDGVVLPQKVVQGETQTVSVNLMNTGKSTIYNCTIDFEVEYMPSGSSVFVGNIEPAQSVVGSVNLRVDSDFVGEVAGKATITYEDGYGEEYVESVDVSTVIEEKVEVADKTEEDEPDKQNPLWWLFGLVGMIVGGMFGFSVPWYIRDRKQRKEDDLRL